MANITQKEYWDEVKSICDSVVEDAMEQYADGRNAVEERMHDALHESIDGHQWIIYNAYHLDILQHASNPDAFMDQMGEMPQVDNISDLHTQLAFSALEEDVQACLGTRLEEALDAAEDEEDEEDEDAGFVVR